MLWQRQREESHMHARTTERRSSWALSLYLHIQRVRSVVSCCARTAHVYHADSTEAGRYSKYQLTTRSSLI